MKGSKDEEEDERSDSPPPLSTLTLKAPQKSFLGLQLTPTLTTSPATPSREQSKERSQSIKSPLKSPKSPTESITKPSPLRSPPKLATLSKPTTQSALATAFARNRNARHSIDVRALPSYLAKTGRRQSTFGQFLTGL
ncbi:unnamed protein product [Medioppia subpectinata]|uniref:Uncharacterized protein n=1 Tax=Medioppia subpectinata TaxID=1979941 RepID=A0A7R9Q4C4_9ACAR|nr:unnamed protein product [Medioppia subpectinata]CAG2112496.1 unnamed protein product [Medioppia subpectinata]